MKWRQYIVLGVGVVIAAYLFAARNIPPQDNALDALARKAKTELPDDALGRIENLENRLDGNVALTDTLAQAWETAGNPAVAAFYRYQAATTINSVAYWNLTGESMTEALAFSRAQGYSENLLFYFAESAIHSFEAALAIDSSNTDARIGLASILIEGKGEVMPGVKLLLEVVAQDSMNVTANLRLGRLSMMNGEYANVVKRMTRVLETEPDNIEALVSTGNAWQALGNAEEAAKYWRAALPLIEDEELKRQLEARINEL